MNVLHIKNILFLTLYGLWSQLHIVLGSFPSPRENAVGTQERRTVGLLCRCLLWTLQILYLRDNEITIFRTVKVGQDSAMLVQKAFWFWMPIWTLHRQCWWKKIWTQFTAFAFHSPLRAYVNSKFGLVSLGPSGPISFLSSSLLKLIGQFHREETNSTLEWPLQNTKSLPFLIPKWFFCIKKKMKSVLDWVVKSRLYHSCDVFNWVEKALVIKHIDYKVVVDLLNRTEVVKPPLKGLKNFNFYQR